MSHEPKRTSFQRYVRVHEILQGDNLLRQRLSKNVVAVCRPDQTHKELPIEVVYVTDEIHKTGKDAYTMPKIEVIRMAHRLLIQNPMPAPAPVSPAALPPPVEVHAFRNGSTAKTKVKVKKAASPKSPAVRKKAAERKPAAVVVDVEAPPAIPVPAKAAKEPVAATPAPAVKSQPAFIRKSIPLVVGIAILNLMQGVLTLLEYSVASGDEEAKDLCGKISSLIDETHRRTVIPGEEKSSAEKESTNAG